MNPRQYDAVIIGGGPAGLTAALWLARYRRSVLVLDSGEPRNEPAWGVHGFPGIVDPSPTELRQRIQEQAINAGAEYLSCSAMSVRGAKNEFAVHVAGGGEYRSRRVLMAYGLRDTLPDIPGAADLYGTSLFHCPDCDGPTVQDHHVSVLGQDRQAASLALYLLNWTDRVTLLANGGELDLPKETLDTLGEYGVALFFHLGSEPRSDIGEQLSCEREDDGYLRVDRGGETSVPGVYAAGDITGHPHLASVAAADGVRAALAIHRSMLPAEWRV
jgi:thioredoxin reductase